MALVWEFEKYPTRYRVPGEAELNTGVATDGKGIWREFDKKYQELFNEAIFNGVPYGRYSWNYGSAPPDGANPQNRTLQGIVWYTVDFHRMTQTNETNGFVRRIRVIRILRPSSSDQRLV